MKVEIKVPAMGESISEATVGQILKPSGSAVKVDDELIELETDKVNQVLYASDAGVVTFDVAVDDTVTIDQVIGHIDSSGAAVAAAKPAKKEETVDKAKKAAEGSPKEAKAEEANKPVRFGKEAFVADLLTEKPKEQAAAPSAPRAAPPPPKPGQRTETRQRMSKIRQVIAKRLVEAQQTSAMLTTFNEVDLSSVMELRQRYKDPFLEAYGARLGFMSFFVKATVSALRAFPGINSYIDGNEFVRREYYDVGIAVGTERGLVVPVLRDCDQLSFADVESGIRDFATRARDGKLSADELQGGGFTITNGGVYGSLLSTPILNPPQSGILGMHKIENRPVVVDGEIVIRPMMYLALSYDHRIVDGQAAVSFLVHIKEHLEDLLVLFHQSKLGDLD